MEVLRMDKTDLIDKLIQNKEAKKLTDEELNKVNSGEFNPFDMDGDGYMDITPLYRCSHCCFTVDGDLYDAGQECPNCYIGYLI